jgi:transposase InsO family protein
MKGPRAVTALNSRWCGGITYIHTWQGWLFLATVTGIASRRVVGFAIADHLRLDASVVECVPGR